MASQSSVDDASQPTTPQNLEVPKTIAQTNNTHATTTATMGSSARPSSITPPPSSQVPSRNIPRSMTPETSSAVLSSPPPTLVNGTKREDVGVVAKGPPTAEEMANATREELVAMLNQALTANSKLDATASEARMSAAHYKFQHQLLSIDKDESIKRLEVELDITRREVEVLQGTGRESTHLEYTQKLKAYCKLLEEELRTSHRRLDKAKRLIEDKDDQIIDFRDEIGRLQDRIRQNREHINTFRSPGGPLAASPKTPAAQTPYRGTPKYTPTSAQRQIRYPQDQQERFNALLAAGESVLSQENNSAPTTPTFGRRPEPRTPNRHNRAVQSLSSFPTAPRSASRPLTASTLLPAPEFSPAADTRMNTVAQNALLELHAGRTHRRRKSRDSTISASDHEELVNATQSSYRDESEEVQESQASQSATEMLRADPRESFEIAASRTHTPLPDKPIKNMQAKLYVPISKVGAAEKRKRDEYESSPAKKARIEGEGIGLGIGFEAARV